MSLPLQSNQLNKKPPMLAILIMGKGFKRVSPSSVSETNAAAFAMGNQRL